MAVKNFLRVGKKGIPALVGGQILVAVRPLYFQINPASFNLIETWRTELLDAGHYQVPDQGGMVERYANYRQQLPKLSQRPGTWGLIFEETGARRVDRIDPLLHADTSGRTWFVVPTEPAHPQPTMGWEAVIEKLRELNVTTIELIGGLLCVDDNGKLVSAFGCVNAVSRQLLEAGFNVTVVNELCLTVTESEMLKTH